MQPVPPSVRNWLIVVAAMIFFMIVIGALTRLTEVRPVDGRVATRHRLAAAAFRYSLAGRAAEVSFLTAGTIGESFFHRRRIQRDLLAGVHPPCVGTAHRCRLRLAARLVLVARRPQRASEAETSRTAGGRRTAEGALGWAMVASGLVDRPAVSHYRLAAHLLLAIALYAYTVWLILELGPQAARQDDPKTRRKATALIGFLFVVLTWGAFMAGLRAGAAHNTFPTMSGHWIPPGLFDLSPWWINLFENGTTIQFIHRWLAKLLVMGVLVMAWRAPRPETMMAAMMAFLQLGLGIATILTGVSIGIATAHQAGAVLLLTALIIVRHRAMPSLQRPV